MHAPEPATDPFGLRRERLLASIGDGVAIIAAAPELVRSRDAEVKYRASPDLFYLTGFSEPDALAVLSPHGDAPFTLFVRPRDPLREAWNGPRAGLEGALADTGADAVHSIADLDELLPALVRPADRIVYAIGTAPELDETVLTLLSRARASRPRSGVGPVGAEDLAAHLDPLRRVKDAAEIAAMREAARVSVEAFRGAIAAAGAGVGEWEVEAALDGTMRRLGATGPAFASIVASGPNATILHYTANGRRIGADDLLLIDAGAELAMYCSDITRTVPVSGTFTPPQRELYELVAEAELAGIAAARPGAPVSGIHEAAVWVLVEGMLRLGLLSGMTRDEAISTGAFRRFYMHQTSHWLGLDVHDVGAYREEGAPVTLQPGMVLTVEPGIYVPADATELPERYRGVGIRIEDSVLITDDGVEVLTGALPVSADAVEALVRGSDAR